jgi:ribosomal protein S18 acetylase RimI-like enzyme
METLLKPLTFPSENAHLRQFEPGRDLNQVADLVELCFASTLDADGHRYLRQMRTAARSPNLARLAGRLGDPGSFPMTGFVWEENGSLVGNLSLIPFPQRGGRLYLIANVAVHPDYRRQGIARALTRAALNYLQRGGYPLPWLQVRDDNPSALELYQSLGFHEQFRRTTWHSGDLAFPQTPAQSDLSISPLRARDRKIQQLLLENSYPPELAWHLPFHIQDLRPDLWGFILRLFSGVFVRQYAARKGGRLVGVLAWQATYGNYNALWLGTDPEFEGAAAAALVSFARQNYGIRRPLTLDYPAGSAVRALQENGFEAHQTLIWMRATRWEPAALR